MRSLHLLGVPLILAACSGAPGPELAMTVVVTENGVRLSAIEVERPTLCDQGQPVALGACGTTSDAWDCGGELPGDWLEGARVELGGTVVARAEYDWPGGMYLEAAVLGARGATLVVTADNGDEIELALPATPAPIPTLTAVDDGVDVVIEWTSEPAAAGGYLGMGDGYGGPFCHVAAHDAVRFPAPTQPGPVGWQASVSSYATPSSSDTSFGTATIRVAATASTPVVPPR